MNLMDAVKDYILNQRKPTVEEQTMLNKIPTPGSYQASISPISEQQMMPMKMTPEQIRANVNMHLYGRTNR